MKNLEINFIKFIFYIKHLISILIKKIDIKILDNIIAKSDLI